MKTLQDLEQLQQGLIDAEDREHVEYSDLPVDEQCTEPFDTSGVWSWVVPLPEHGNRPQYLLVGDGEPETWKIIDVLQDPDGWPRNLVIRAG